MAEAHKINFYPKPQGKILRGNTKTTSQGARSTNTRTACRTSQTHKTP